MYRQSIINFLLNYDHTNIDSVYNNLLDLGDKTNDDESFLDKDFVDKFIPLQVAPTISIILSNYLRNIDFNNSNLDSFKRKMLKMKCGYVREFHSNINKLMDNYITIDKFSQYRNIDNILTKEKLENEINKNVDLLSDPEFREITIDSVALDYIYKRHGIEELLHNIKAHITENSFRDIDFVIIDHKFNKNNSKINKKHAPIQYVGFKCKIDPKHTPFEVFRQTKDKTQGFDPSEKFY